MISIKNTWISFKNRGGHFVFSSSILSKIIGFILSVLIVRILPETVYGNISYAMSIMMIIIPMSGMGLHHSLLRYGSIESDNENKNNLFVRFLKSGSIASVFMIITLILFSKLISKNVPDAQKFILLLSPLILTFFISELLFSYFRTQKNNKQYSFGMILKSILMLVLCIVFSIIAGGDGYVIAYVVVPLIVAILMLIKGKNIYGINIAQSNDMQMSEYIKYGLWVGVGTIASKLVVMLDIIMVGNIIGDSLQLAIYKVATIIPTNLMFIPMLLLRTDYVYFAEKYQNTKFLINY